MTPPEANLSDFDYFPLEIERWKRSGSVELPPEQALAAIFLWTASWHEVPAASLPNDDKELAKFAGMRGDPKRWRSLKEGAMRGFVLCSDGRYYHPVVAERALVSWIERLGYRRRSGAGNAAKYGRPFDPDALEAQINDAVARLQTLKEQGRAAIRNSLKEGAAANLLQGEKPADSDLLQGAKVKEKVEGEGRKRTHPSGGQEKAAPSAPQPSKGSRIEASWFADEQDRAFAEKRGLTPEETGDQEDRFRDFWLQRSGEIAVKRDWHAAWRNWVRTAKEESDERRGRRGGGAQRAGDDRRGVRSPERVREALEGIVEAVNEGRRQPPDD